VSTASTLTDANASLASDAYTVYSCLHKTNMTKTKTCLTADSHERTQFTKPIIKPLKWCELQLHTVTRGTQKCLSQLYGAPWYYSWLYSTALYSVLASVRCLTGLANNAGSVYYHIAQKHFSLSNRP